MILPNIFIALIAGIAALLLGSAEAQLTVIKAGNLVDPVTATIQTAQTIVIEEGKIISVGESPTIPAHAVQINLTSRTVLPGLIDSHTHLAASYKFPTSNLKQYNVDVSTAHRAIQGLLNAESMLKAGFTTVRDLGNAGNFADTALLHFLSAPPIANMGQVAEFAAPQPGQLGRVLGPTAFISGKIISNMIAGENTNLDLSPYSSLRFS